MKWLRKLFATREDSGISAEWAERLRWLEEYRADMLERHRKGDIITRKVRGEPLSESEQAEFDAMLAGYKAEWGLT